MATIDDVAEQAGVSKKTVSRVMNGHQHVSTKTKSKVEQAMQVLNYAPSSIARQMRLGDTQSIGMLYGDPSSGYQAQLNHSMLKACSDARRYLAVELFDENSSGWARQIEQFLDRTRVTNLVLVPPMCDSNEIHDLLNEKSVRFVLVSPSRIVSGSHSVAMDDRLAAAEATRHLIGLGHTRIGHIAGRDGHIGTLLRRLGFEDALMTAGLGAAEPAQIISGGFRFRHALQCAEDMLTAPDRPTAIFAANDQMAVASIMVAHRLGLSVPEDLSIIGFDNTTISRNIWPELTTIAQPFDEMAHAAVAYFDSCPVSAAPTTTEILRHSLVVRGSTGPAPIK